MARITLDSLPRPDSPLTVRETILSAICKGVFPWVAAAAAGVSRRRFRRWLRSKKEPYRQFALEVRQTYGWARLHAEMTLYEADLRLWLTRGPGREVPGRPGWTREAAPEPLAEARRRRSSPHPLENPAWQELFAQLLDALTPFPEARRALAEVLHRRQRPRQTLNTDDAQGNASQGRHSET